MTMSRPKAGTGFKFLLSAACVVVVIAGLRSASEMLIPIVLGIFLAILSLPILKSLMRWGLPRPLAIGMTIVFDLTILLVVGVMAMSVIPEFQSEKENYAELLRKRLSTWTESIDKRLESFGDFMDNFSVDFESEGAEGASDPDGLDVSGELATAGSGSMLTTKELFNRYWDSMSIINFFGLTDLVQKLTSLLSKSFFVLIIMIFVLAESGQFSRKFSTVLRSRGPDLSRFEESAADIQKYLGIKTAVSLATGLLAFFACKIFGVAFPVLWGLVAFAFNYIPAIGSILAAVPPVLLALIESGFWPAIGVFICYLVINIALGNFLEPMLLGNRFGISTIVVILSVLFWGYIWGPVGMFLAVPLTMMVKVMLDNSTDLQWISVLMGKQRGTLGSGRKKGQPPAKKSALPPASADAG